LDEYLCLENRILKGKIDGRICFTDEERWVRSVTEECLSHLILFGLDSLRRVLNSYRGYFNALRPHRGLGNGIPARVAGDQARRADVEPSGELRAHCTELLGGLLKSYSVAA